MSTWKRYNKNVMCKIKASFHCAIIKRECDYDCKNKQNLFPCADFFLFLHSSEMRGKKGKAIENREKIWKKINFYCKERFYVFWCVFLALVFYANKQQQHKEEAKGTWEACIVKRIIVTIKRELWFFLMFFLLCYFTGWSEKHVNTW